MKNIGELRVIRGRAVRGGAASGGGRSVCALASAACRHRDSSRPPRRPGRPHRIRARSRAAAISPGGRLVRPTSAAASTTSPSIEAHPSTFYVGFATGRRLEDHQQRHHLRAALRRAAGRRRSATSPSPRRIPTSSTSAPARPTTARARRSAPASTSPADAGKSWTTSGSKRPRASRASSSIHGIRTSPTSRRSASVRTESRARPLQDDRRRQDLDQHQVHRQRHGLHRCRDGSRQPQRALRRVLPAAPRQPWGFNGGGPGSGMWKTTDAGKTWTKFSGNGLPTNPIIGRIGLDIARSHAADDLRVDRSRARAAARAPASTTTARCRHRRQRDVRRIRRRPRQPAAASPDPNKSGIWRIGRRREELEVPVELDGSADVLQPDPRGSDQPGYRVSGRRAVLQDRGRRQDLEAGAGTRAQRPPRDLDRSEATTTT